MDVEQNIADIKESIGRLEGMMEPTAKILPKLAPKVEGNFVRSTFNRKLIYFILTVIIAGSSITGVVSSLNNDQKIEKTK